MLPSMSAPLLAYRKAANPNFESGEYGGRVWLAEHDVCPYCLSPLTELGSFHAPAHNLVKVEDPNFAPAFLYEMWAGTYRRRREQRETLGRGRSRLL